VKRDFSFEILILPGNFFSAHLLPELVRILNVQLVQLLDMLVDEGHWDQQQVTVARRLGMSPANTAFSLMSA